VQLVLLEHLVVQQVLKDQLARLVQLVPLVQLVHKEVQARLVQ